MTNTKPFLAGVAIGAIVIPILGFSALGWRLDSKAQAMVADATQAAMMKAFVPICMAQFRNDPAAQANLNTLKAEQYSQGRSEFIRVGGWAVAPGHEEARNGISNACANALIAEK